MARKGPFYPLTQAFRGADIREKKGGLSYQITLEVPEEEQELFDKYFAAFFKIEKPDCEPWRFELLKQKKMQQFFFSQLEKFLQDRAERATPFPEVARVAGSMLSDSWVKVEEDKPEEDSGFVLVKG